MDEKSQIQALDPTQASLPMVPGRAGTMTHDYKRNGTTTLFAALDVLTGTVIGQCLPRHRHTDFIRFLNPIDREVPDGLAVHLILDNYSTHKHAEVNRPGMSGDSVSWERRRTLRVLRGVGNRMLISSTICGPESTIGGCVSRPTPNLPLVL